MTTFTDKYGDLTPEQVEGLRAVARAYRSPMEAIPRLIESVTTLQPTYGNVQYVLDILSGQVVEEDENE